MKSEESKKTNNYDELDDEAILLGNLNINQEMDIIENPKKHIVEIAKDKIKNGNIICEKKNKDNTNNEKESETTQNRRKSLKDRQNLKLMVTVNK